MLYNILTSKNWCHWFNLFIPRISVGAMRHLKVTGDIWCGTDIVCPLTLCCREATVTAEMDRTEGLKLQLSEVTLVGETLAGTVLASVWVADSHCTITLDLRVSWLAFTVDPESSLWNAWDQLLKCILFMDCQQHIQHLHSSGSYIIVLMDLSANFEACTQFCTAWFQRDFWITKNRPHI